ncbi:nitroreductase family protein [Oligoflexaceae bacterium]|nr:nitroreductase family protein [Oligoflexaceae bacterium]
MDVIEAIESRRAVKHYDTSYKMPVEHIEKMDELIRASPTAFNIQNWRIVKVTDPEQRKRIRAAAWDQAQVTDASLLYVLCGDLSAWKKDPARYWEKAPQEVRDFMTTNITAYYKDKPQVQRDEVMRSCDILAQTIMIAAKGLGYDSCPMDGFDFDAVAKIINLPEELALAMFVVVGKSEKPAREKGGFIPNEEVFAENSF